MKKLFELPEADFMKLQVGDHQTLTELGKEHGFKPETVEFTGGGTTQFFAEKAVKELTPVLLGAEMNAENFTAVQLAKLPYKVEDLQKKAEEYSKLEVKDVNDKEGLKILTKARIELKGDVAGIRKAGKQLREFTTQFNRDVIAREDELAGIIEPVRDALQKRENEIEEEKERIRLAKEKEEDDRIQGFISKLAAVGHAVDYSEIKGYTDERFEEVLTEAINIHNEKVKRDQEEADRLRLEKEKAERERQEEIVRLEKQRKQQDEENRKIAAQQEQIREQQEKIRKDKEAIEIEKQKLAESKTTDRTNKMLSMGFSFVPLQQHIRFATPGNHEVMVITIQDIAKSTDEEFADMIEKSDFFIRDAWTKNTNRILQKKKEEADQIAREKQEAIDKALREKAEQEQKAKELAEERAAAASDHDKLVALAETLEKMAYPECKSKNGQLLVHNVRTTLDRAAEIIRHEMFNEGKDVL